MSQLAPVSSANQIKAEDELDWLFSGAGACVFERSTLGAQLDQMKLFAASSEPCPICNTDGRGLSPGILDDGSWCEECEAVGHVAVKHTGSHVFATVIPKPTHAREDCYEMDQDIMRAAELSRAVRIVESRKPRLAMALEAFHGPRGLLWRDHKMVGPLCTVDGRHLPVFSLTATGLAAIKHEQSIGTMGSADELCAAWLARPKRTTDAVRDALDLMAEAWGAYIAARGWL